AQIENTSFIPSLNDSSDRSTASSSLLCRRPLYAAVMLKAEPPVLCSPPSVFIKPPSIFLKVKIAAISVKGRICRVLGCTCINDDSTMFLFSSSISVRPFYLPIYHLCRLWRLGI
ncbi:hypothetical protein A2U01_0061065, partial [Trifolium medium]|nr:hypothetical protein [Trifolium medium]